MIFSPRSRSTICLLRRKYQLLTTCTHSHHWATRSSPCRTTLCHTASYRKTQSSSWCLLHESIIRPSASRIPSAWRPRRSRPRFELSSISSFGFSFFPGLSGADRLRHPFLFQSVAAAVGAPRAVRLGRAARAEGTDPHLNFYFCDLIQFQNAAKKYNFGSE